MDDAKVSLVKRIFEQARFVRLLGIELIGLGDGWCETRVIVTPMLEQQHASTNAHISESGYGAPVSTRAPRF